MSYYQHTPSPALVLSFAGGLSPEQEKLLAHVLTKYPSAEVVTATDADSEGDAYAALVEAIRPDARRDRPAIGKDWNDAIRPAFRLHCRKPVLTPPSDTGKQQP